MTRRIVRGALGILLGFSALWAMCIAAREVTGRPLTSAFPHKIWVLLGIVLSQIGLAASVPIRKQLDVWLRLSAITGFLLLGAGTLITSLRTAGDVDAEFSRLWWWVTVVFAAGIWVRLAPVLKKRIPNAATVASSGHPAP